MSKNESVDFTKALGRDTLRIVDAVLALWPEHGKFLRASLANRSEELLNTTEAIAALLVQVAAKAGRPLQAYAEDYQYLCQKIVFPEELFFQREGRYRLSTFAEAAREVYNNAPLMNRYMNGLFVSDVLWLNHASAMNDFVSTFLPTTRPDGAHLEIGPGHGMLLHLAIRFGKFASLDAWDVSATSVEQVRRVLEALGQSHRVRLRQLDLYAEEAIAQHRGRFDTIVLSEVLEHLERPAEAVAIIAELLAPGGSVWINVPANGPAPDHLYLLRSPDEAAALVSASGLTVTRVAAFPVAGSSLERALAQDLPISCVVVGTRAA